MKKIIGIAVALALATSPALAAEWGQFGMPGLRIAVKDPAKSIEFYKHVGMKVGRLYHPDQQEMAWDNPSQGSSIVLMSGESGLIPGHHYFLINVPDTVAVVKELRAAGFDVPDPKTTNHVGVDAKDPDGNILHLMSPVPKK